MIPDRVEARRTDREWLDPASPGARRRTAAWLRAALWLLALVPPALALRWTLVLASPAPEPQEWRTIWGEEPLALAWDEFPDFEGGPNDLAFRAVHLLGLDTLGLDSGRIAVLSWLLAGAAVAVLTSLAARTGAGPLATPAVAFALGAAAWSPAYGADWLLGERFRVFIPGAATVLGALLLAGRAPAAEASARAGGFRRRFLAAGALAGAALFSDRTGVLTWIALAPLVPAASRARGRGNPARALAIWCLLGAMATALRHDEAVVTSPARTGILGDLAQAPAAAGEFLLEAAGLGLPDLVPGRSEDNRSMGAAWLGAAAALLLAAALVRRSGRGPAALPWIALVAHGAGSALLLAESFHPPPLPGPYLREMTWAGFLLPAGVCGLAGAVLGRAARPVLGAVIAAYVAASVPDWETGMRHLGLEARLLRQGEAALAWTPAAGPVIARPLEPPLSLQRAADLYKRGGLRRVPLEESTSIAADARAPLAALPGCGALDSVEGRTAAGEVVDRPDGLVPDAVLLSRKASGAAEAVFRICAPGLFTGGDPRPWRVEFAEAAEFADGEEVRALGYDARRGRLFRLRGAAVFRDGAFAPLPEDGR